jgi:hypothetical protein|tara:strand:+ start:9986 stop:10243 length:258 start_codon:yes stop_codon:yes gene_type:complete
MDRKHETYDSNGNIIETIYREFTWEHVRKIRDYTLKASDWRFMSDQTPSQEWIDYRVFLRDLPQNHESANDAADAWELFEKPEGA